MTINHKQVAGDKMPLDFNKDIEKEHKRLGIEDKSQQKNATSCVEEPISNLTISNLPPDIFLEVYLQFKAECIKKNIFNQDEIIKLFKATCLI